MPLAWDTRQTQLRDLLGNLCHPPPRCPHQKTHAPPFPLDACAPFHPPPPTDHLLPLSPLGL